MSVIDKVLHKVAAKPVLTTSLNMAELAESWNRVSNGQK